MAATTDTVKSFQNSTAGVPGYNDCPDFLFQVSRKSTPVSSRRNKISTNMIDNKIMSSVIKSELDSAKRTSTPPPPIMRSNGRKTPGQRTATTSSSSSSPIVPTVSKNTTENEVIQTDISVLSSEEILKRVNLLLQTTSSLPEREHTFYRRKIDTNITESLSSDSTRYVLSQFFEVLDVDKIRALKLLKEWMVTDMTIGKWCPAFVKIFENAQVV